MVMVHKFMDRDETVPTVVAQALGKQKPTGGTKPKDLLMVADSVGAHRGVPSGKTFGVVNTSERILLMIDEAHRTQGSRPRG